MTTIKYKKSKREQSRSYSEFAFERYNKLTDRQLKTVECADDGLRNREPHATTCQESFVACAEFLRGILRTLPMHRDSKHNPTRDSVKLPKGLRIGGRGPARKGKIKLRRGSCGIEDFGWRSYRTAQSILVCFLLFLLDLEFLFGNNLFIGTRIARR
ncbi:hypothetical protein F2Q70_00011277 [Brassica cretica]|uniref:Uncharacterized protein n=1 Tax=Brassica cretica TaxID=69181 RepID=A0A8S9LZ94_BRACR|nr:hypothetical protein F2Q70_00011277 [Brassica cretica]